MSVIVILVVYPSDQNGRETMLSDIENAPSIFFIILYLLASCGVDLFLHLVLLCIEFSMFETYYAWKKIHFRD